MLPIKPFFSHSLPISGSIVTCCSCLGFEISEYQKRQAALTVRKVTKQKGEATRRYQVISLLLFSLVCSVFSSLFTLPLPCSLFFTFYTFFSLKRAHYVYEWLQTRRVLRKLETGSELCALNYFPSSKMSASPYVKRT